MPPLACEYPPYGIGFTELSNGFATTDDPAALQDICDRLDRGTINVFVQRWLAHLPLPLSDTDRDAGYWWETSMQQIEISRILVFDAPRRARGFFEALTVGNLDIGRPHNAETIFGGRVRRNSSPDGTVRLTGVHSRVSCDVTLLRWWGARGCR